MTNQKSWKVSFNRNLLIKSVEDGSVGEVSTSGRNTMKIRREKWQNEEKIPNKQPRL
jgi:hypothetical protein